MKREENQGRRAALSREQLFAIRQERLRQQQAVAEEAWLSYLAAEAAAEAIRSEIEDPEGGAQ